MVLAQPPAAQQPGERPLHHPAFFERIRHMIVITVTIHVLEDRDRRNIERNLVLQTLAPLTPDNAKSKSFGRWECSSYYLGDDLTGRYYVKNNKNVPDNPVGFFLDSKGEDDDPLLVLQGFNPMSMKIGDSGDGRILRTRMTDVTWTDVRWQRTK